ncbi:MAG: hypothetical protein ACE5EQ_12055 [Phycisphaerae bacterium]
MKASNGNDKLWQPDELAAILRHQLAASIEYDLSRMNARAALKLKTNAESKGLLLKSFADLFAHPHPPLELLEMTKEFAKANRNDPDRGVPVEISTMLYYACIAAALVHCRKRITGLDDATLSKGFQWGRGQPWVDETTAGLFTEALQTLEGATGDAT